MPVPDSHLSHLQQDLARHQEALARAREQQIRLDTEVALHKFVLNTAENPNVMAFLNAMADDPELFGRLDHDTAAMLDEYQVKIPDWVTVRVIRERQAVRAEFSIHGSRFYVEWDSEYGFTAREDEVR